MDACRDGYHRGRSTAELLACLTGRVVILLVGTNVRFLEDYRPPQVRWGATGTVIDLEERLQECWVRARFGDFITPWIEAWQLERVP
jgi:hypothetical protein